MLSYESTGRGGISSVRVIFLREVGAQERDWWQGGLGFELDEVERPAELRGETTFFGRAGVPDVAFILEKLEGWFSRFKIKWYLRMNGEDWGAIDPGDRSKYLVASLDKWSGRAKVLWNGKGSWNIDGRRRADIAVRHAKGS